MIPGGLLVAAVTIEVFTMGPGDRLVERFGHAALCVRSPDRPDRDRCYNYGTTDFADPASLVWGFVRGDAEFWVEAWTRDEMLAYYEDRDRSIWVQVLDDDVLPAEARRRIAAKLERDARPENKYYAYHHFDDNCSTRVRDIVDDAAGGALGEGSTGRVGPTFRDYGMLGFAGETWLLMTLDVAAGRSADERPTEWEAMFLPRVLRQAIAEKLGAEPQLVYERRGPPVSEGAPGARTWFLLVAALVALPAVLSRIVRRRQRLGLGVSAFVLGLVGFVLWMLAAVSSLDELRYNEALVLFVPTDWALMILAPERRRRYARFRLGMILVAALLLAAGLFSQPLWLPALIALPTLAAAAIPER